MSELIIEHFPANRQTLAFLEPSLRTMGAVIDRYTDFFARMYPEAEIPYKYNERATLSQLASGISLSHPDNLVLEEFTDDKQCDAGRYRGRGDIWFSIGGILGYGEAKQGWAILTQRRPRGITRLLGVLRAECEAAHWNSERHCVDRTVHIPVGILFIVLTAKRSCLEGAEQSLRAYHERLRRSLTEFAAMSPYDVL
jgi:hypothetical protein